jgi:hypothetical protein
MVLPMHTEVSAKRVRRSPKGENDVAEVTLYQGPSNLFTRLPVSEMQNYYQLDKVGFETKAEYPSDIKVGDRLIVDNHDEEATYLVHGVKSYSIVRDLNHMVLTCTREESS